MNDIAKLLTPITQGTASFPQGSRYHGAPLKVAALPDGREVRYVGRRFIPPADRQEVAGFHAVGGGDRLDLLAAQYFGAPTQGWKILDANGILDPRDALSDIGRRLVIGESYAPADETFE